MHKTMNLREQQDSAAALRSQLATGMPVADAAARLVRLQPPYAQFWADAAARMRNGLPLSESLLQVWPAAAVSAVRAGEANGRMPEVLGELAKSIRLQRRIIKSARKILYPASVMAGAVCLFVGFMLTIVPSIAKSLNAAKGAAGAPTGIAGLGIQGQQFLADNWIAVTVVLVGTAFAAVSWLRAPKTHTEIVRLLLATPLIGDALRSLYFGLWARYMAISCGAGIPTVDSLKNTVEILPAPLHDGVLALAVDLGIRNRPISEAADPDAQPAGDARRRWPFYVCNALMIGDSTGRLDAELDRVSPELVETGEEALERAIGIANTIAVVFAAVLLGAAMLIVYLPMLQQMKAIQ